MRSRLFTGVLMMVTSAGLLGAQFRQERNAERFERGFIELLAEEKIGDGKTDVVEHG